MLSVHVWSYCVQSCYAYIPFEMTGVLSSRELKQNTIKFQYIKRILNVYFISYTGNQKRTNISVSSFKRTSKKLIFLNLQTLDFRNLNAEAENLYQCQALYCFLMILCCWGTRCVENIGLYSLFCISLNIFHVLECYHASWNLFWTLILYFKKKNSLCLDFQWIEACHIIVTFNHDFDSS